MALRGAQLIDQVPDHSAPHCSRDPGRTSAWVEYYRATGSTVDRRSTELISHEAPLAVTEPVVMEVVASVRSDVREADVR